MDCRGLPSPASLLINYSNNKFSHHTTHRETEIPKEISHPEVVDLSHVIAEERKDNYSSGLLVVEGVALSIFTLL
jgi:hypothetical protein